MEKQPKNKPCNGRSNFGCLFFFKPNLFFEPRGCLPARIRLQSFCAQTSASFMAWRERPSRDFAFSHLEVVILTPNRKWPLLWIVIEIFESEFVHFVGIGQQANLKPGGKKLKSFLIFAFWWSKVLCHICSLHCTFPWKVFLTKIFQGTCTLWLKMKIHTHSVPLLRGWKMQFTIVQSPIKVGM